MRIKIPKINFDRVLKKVIKEAEAKSQVTLTEVIAKNFINSLKDLDEEFIVEGMIKQGKYTFFMYKL